MNINEQIITGLALATLIITLPLDLMGICAILDKEININNKFFILEVTKEDNN